MTEATRPRKRRGALALLVIALGGVAAWLALDAEARTKAYDLCRRTLVFLQLAPPALEGAAFWCPMHPEIRRQAPGTCPI